MSNKVPLLRFNGYSDAWVQRKLSELMSFSNGINAAKEQYGTGRKMISVMDILTPGRMKFENILNSVSVSHDIEEKNLVNSGDLVFVRSSEVTSEVGWAKAYTDSNPALFSGFSIRGKKATSFDSVFVELALNSRGRRQIERQAGGSTRFNASQGLLSNIAINMPSEEEQSKISSMMLQLDNLIAANQRKLDLLKEQKKGYLQKMFPKNGEKVPELRFAGFADDWEERKLSNYITITGGNAWKSSDYSIGGDYLVVTIANVQGERNINDKIGNKISVADPGKYLLKREDILVSLTGNVGRVSRMTDIPAVLNQRVGLVKPKTKKIDDEFLFQVLSNRRFESSMVASGQGAAQANISNNDVLSYELLVPQDVREQSIIAHFFRNFDNAIALHQRKLGLLKEQKKGFLQKMFV